MTKALIFLQPENALLLFIPKERFTGYRIWGHSFFLSAPEKHCTHPSGLTVLLRNASLKFLSPEGKLSSSSLCFQECFSSIFRNSVMMHLGMGFFWFIWSGCAPLLESVGLHFAKSVEF